MAWIESHQQLKDNPKLYDLCASMGWAKHEAVGYLHLLWYWCVDYAEDGDLTRHNGHRIALAIGLPPKEGERFLGALCEAGLLDTLPYLRIHDWWDYFGKYLQSKYRRSPQKWERIRDLYRSGGGAASSMSAPDPVLTTPPFPESSIPEIGDTEIGKTEGSEPENRDHMDMVRTPYVHPTEDARTPDAQCTVNMAKSTQFVRDTEIYEQRTQKGAIQPKTTVGVHDSVHDDVHNIACTTLPYLTKPNLPNIPNIHNLTRPARAREPDAGGTGGRIFNSDVPTSAEEAVAFFEKLGSCEDEARKFLAYYGKRAWVIKREPVRNWQSLAWKWIEGAPRFAAPDRTRDDPSDHAPPAHVSRGDEARSGIARPLAMLLGAGSNSSEVSPGALAAAFEVFLTANGWRHGSQWTMRGGRFCGAGIGEKWREFEDTIRTKP